MIDKYRHHYSEASFWNKIWRFARSAGKEIITLALTLYACFRDADTPSWARTVILGALGYFIFPLDQLPDIAPLVGYADDLGVLMAVLAMVAAHVKPEHRAWAETKAGILFNSFVSKPSKDLA
jgi:uncharacterized membrane protein YkvA (DUF1232 family)